MKAATRSSLRKAARQRFRSRRGQPASTGRADGPSGEKDKLRLKLKSGHRIRRRSHRKPPSVIPSILFEGDDPILPQTTSTTKPATIAAGLPAAYGTRRLVLTPRDPQWLHAHWDFTREQLREANARSAEGHLTLKLFEATTLEPLVSETRVHPESTRWFVHVQKPGTRYFAQVGYYDTRRNWCELAVSEPAESPPGAPSAEGRFEMATLAEDGTITRHPVVPKAREEWTPERERDVGQVLHQLAFSTPQFCSSELAQRSFPTPTSPADLGWNVDNAPTSLSSPVGGVAGGRKSFWLRINADVVVHGATDPQATVKVGDQVVPLDQDGSFRVRFSLPDGAYTLPVVATAAAGDDERIVRLDLSRATGLQGEVIKQPPDPALGPPPAKSS